MDIKEMRAEVMKINTSKAWKTSIRNATDDEVLAIYLDQEIKKRVDDLHEELLKPYTQVPFTDCFTEIITPTRTIEYPYPTGQATIRMSYEDMTMGDYMICPKEAVLKGWNDLLGKTFEFAGNTRRVERVYVISNLIFVDLSAATQEQAATIGEISNAGTNVATLATDLSSSIKDFKV